VLAAMLFVLANGLSASGLHVSLHEPAEASGPYAHAHGTAAGEAHRAVRPSAPDTHHHDTSDDCACIGTCAGATPRPAPSGTGELSSLGGEERSAPTPVGVLRSLGQLNPYLFPLPNAPPPLA
jgi:hypothetical protein